MSSSRMACLVLIVEAAPKYYGIPLAQKDARVIGHWSIGHVWNRCFDPNAAKDWVSFKYSVA